MTVFMSRTRPTDDARDTSTMYAAIGRLAAVCAAVSCYAGTNWSVRVVFHGLK
jgi:hypothetical protein